MADKNLRRAVFLDRDGVINEVVERGPNFWVGGREVVRTAPFSLAEFKMKVYVREALEIIDRAGFLKILVSNQPDLSYGTLSPREHELIMQEVFTLPLDDVFLCLHGREEGCTCKKPKPGLLIQAARKWNIDLPNSLMVGDTEADMKAGKTAGCQTILVRTGYNAGVTCDYSVDDLLEAAILLRTLAARRE